MNKVVSNSNMCMARLQELGIEMPSFVGEDKRFDEVEERRFGWKSERAHAQIRFQGSMIHLLLEADGKELLNASQNASHVPDALTVFLKTYFMRGQNESVRAGNHSPEVREGQESR